AGGLGLATGHNALIGGLLNAIFKGGVQRLGPASIAGKLNVYLSGGDGLDLINTYTVLGDPALRLPTYSISAWSKAVAKSGNPGTVVTYSLPVTNLAYLQDQITITLSGNAWSTDVAAPVVLPQTTTNAVVSVTIPSLTLPGVTDVVSVTIASQGREVPNDYAVLTTTANAFYHFNLSTPLAAQSQLRNTVVSYTLQLTNSGNLADVFTLNNSGNVWPCSLSTYSLTMQPFASTDIIVSTTIPSSALMTEMDVVTVTVKSKGSGLSKLQAFKTTAGAPYSVLLPLVLRNK
ncbi:MAG TPA: hypothetical protein VFK30_09135, partial [Anaerolineae bacterium]|nr:hypothetical protein [Anaerolineae bacterium]